MEVVCMRSCYNSTSMKLFEKGRVYEEDDRELEGRGLMKHFRPLNGLPPEKAETLVAKEEAVREKSKTLAKAKKAK